MMRLLVATAAAAAACVAAGPSARAQCPSEWKTGFSLPGVGTVYAAAVYDDGAGPALYIGGRFNEAGPLVNAGANNIARWNGVSWTPIQNGVDGDVYALAVYDDGAGPALFAGGAFNTAGGVLARRLARWNGSFWSGVGGGVVNSVGSAVYALRVHDNGAGPTLIVGGRFDSVGVGPSVPAMNIAGWNGAVWSMLGTGVTNAAGDATVFALATYADGGSAAALYAGGAFTSAGGASASNIARWSGGAWSNAGSGLTRSAGGAQVRALAVYADGQGPSGGASLYAGGRFDTAGSLVLSNLARWDGQAWFTVAGGVSGPPGGTNRVLALHTHDDGAGPMLLVGGEFTTAGGAPSPRIAAWTGTAWSALGAGVTSSPSMPNYPAAGVFAFASYNDTGVPLASASLMVGGQFAGAGGLAVRNIARYRGGTWGAIALGATANDAGQRQVNAMTLHTESGVTSLYAGGAVQGIGGAGAVARWTGTRWVSVGSLSGTVSALASVADGNGPGGGPALYAAGVLNAPGWAFTSRVSRWTGTSWAPMEAGAPSAGVVSALIGYDDGAGPALHAGGTFTTIGGVSALRIAKRTVSGWAPVGGGITSGPFFGTGVNALAVFADGGPRPRLYAAGRFSAAGGQQASNIARWDGASWQDVGAGLMPSPGDQAQVAALLVHADAGGPALYAGGQFATAGGIGVSGVARWDGVEWSALAGGVGSVTGDPILVASLASHDDGSGNGPNLYVGGLFTLAGDVDVNNIARWTGTRWTPLGNGVTTSPFAPQAPATLALASVIEAPGQPATLFAGGAFLAAGSTQASAVARWARAACCPGDANGDGRVDFLDLNIVLASFGAVGSGLAGDVNADGAVNFLDLNIVLAVYGVGC